MSLANTHTTNMYEYNQQMFRFENLLCDAMSGCRTKSGMVGNDCKEDNVYRKAYDTLLTLVAELSQKRMVLPRYPQPLLNQHLTIDHIIAAHHIAHQIDITTLHHY